MEIENQSEGLQEMLSLFGVHRRQDTGFSLLELMIVVAITAVLAAVAVPGYFNHTMRSRQSEVVGELMSIKAAQERYFADTGGYAGRMNLLKAGESRDAADMYAVANTYTNGYYQYWIPANTTNPITTGFIMAKGDLNGDGNYTDEWRISIDNLDGKPEQTGSNEGFTWSSLGKLFK